MITHIQPLKQAMIWFILCLPWACFAQNTPQLALVWVEGGIFKMGCSSEQDANCAEDAQPIHPITLSGFYIGQFEVTQVQWVAVMGSNPSNFSGCNDCPVDGVTWQEAKTFCQKLSQLTGEKYQLPTEAQWEYAARGGQKSQGFLYAGADDPQEVAWFKENSEEQTHPVGNKKSNELQIYDMSGNVWEWCLDGYDKQYYAQSPSKDPQGASQASHKVIRGGSFSRTSADCRVAHRDSSIADGRISRGFRVVRIP